MTIESEFNKNIQRKTYKDQYGIKRVYYLYRGD